jgi:hypothetical protein
MRAWQMNGYVSKNREDLFMETPHSGAYRVGARNFRDICVPSRQVIVVYDPIPVEEGGFKVGAVLFLGEWKEMKKLEVVSKGFKVKLPSGKIEEIC